MRRRHSARRCHRRRALTTSQQEAGHSHVGGHRHSNQVGQAARPVVPSLASVGLHAWVARRALPRLGRRRRALPADQVACHLADQVACHLAHRVACHLAHRVACHLAGQAEGRHNHPCQAVGRAALASAAAALRHTHRRIRAVGRAEGRRPSPCPAAAAHPCQVAGVSAAAGRHCHHRGCRSRDSPPERRRARRRIRGSSGLLASVGVHPTARPHAGVDRRPRPTRRRRCHRARRPTRRRRCHRARRPTRRRRCHRARSRRAGCARRLAAMAHSP
jgi:hypothetical protein